MPEDLRNRTDFMLEEYRQIASAFFNLSEQRSKMIQNYLTLVALPFGVLAAIVVLGVEQTQITVFPTIVGAFVLLIGIAGILISAMLVQMRFEMISYARTINLVRKYFAEETTGPSIEKYLGLPTTEELPRFRQLESKPWLARNMGVYFEILFIGVINIILFYIALFAIVTPFLPPEHIGVYPFVYALIAILPIPIQILLYNKWGRTREVDWKTDPPSR